MSRKSHLWSVVLASAFIVTFPKASNGAESRWIRLRTSNFEMYSSADPRSARETMQEFEQVREFFLQAFGGPPAKSVPVRLVAFGSEREFQPYRMTDYAVAYYLATPDRDYIVMGRSGADTFPIAAHEYVHLLVKHSGLKFPSWLNEGLAEFYSTMRPAGGGKVLVGDWIPGRRQALLRGGWVSLSAVLAAGRDVYNDKSKMETLYNEGWALAHMLYCQAEYRPKFGELLRSISGGEESAQALTRIYGRPLEQIERDLQAHLRGDSSQGALVPARLDQMTGEIPVESLDDFNAQLMFADLTYRPGNEARGLAAYERLAELFPNRPEPCRVLAYSAWRGGQRDKATELFRKAYERGDRDETLSWDYGRLLEAGHEEEAMRILSDLLSRDADRVDVRLELAELQLRSNLPTAALRTLDPIRAIAPENAPRYFRIVVYAEISNGDQQAASRAAKRFLDSATTDQAREAARQLVTLTAGRKASITAISSAKIQPSAMMEAIKDQPRNSTDAVQ